jgi:hypothetical protein
MKPVSHSTDITLSALEMLHIRETLLACRAEGEEFTPALQRDIEQALAMLGVSEEELEEYDDEDEE